jgi:hypothetical protein
MLQSRVWGRVPEGGCVAIITFHRVKMRYYEQKYPEIDELVMVQVRQIAEMGAYVKLVSRDKTC